jgi:ABC-2 type transport system permease protein
MFRIGFLDALAYRVEMVIWILSTTMPLVMFLLWSAAASGQTFGRYGDAEFRGYFLATFVVRQLAGAWAAWQINQEIRDGTLALRLLRPAHPLLHYAAEQVAHVPVRAFISLPLAFILFCADSSLHAPRDPVLLLLFCLSVLGAWALSFLVNISIGSLAFFTEQSNKVMELWTSAFFVFSGYLVPLDLFPKSVRSVVAWLPFRFQLGLPVELLTGQHTRAAGGSLVFYQWLLVLAAAGVAIGVFQRGVRRFEAYGG